CGRRAGAMEAGEGLIAVVEGADEPLPALFFGLVERDEFGHLRAPVLAAAVAERLQEIEAAHDFGEPLHLALVGRVDGERLSAEAEGERGGGEEALEGQGRQ